MNNLLKLVYVLGLNLHHEISIRQLSKEAGLPYTSAYRLVRDNPSVFSINKKGNMKLCSLNTADDITKNYLILAERAQADLFRSKNAQFKVLQKDLPEGDYTLILFGSRAEGTQRSKSDIDLCVVNKDGKKNIKFSRFELLFKVDINPMFFTKKEFTLMLKDKEHNVAREILKKHKILYGEEYFWNLIWGNGF